MLMDLSRVPNSRCTRNGVKKASRNASCTDGAAAAGAVSDGIKVSGMRRARVRAKYLSGDLR